MSTAYWGWGEKVPDGRLFDIGRAFRIYLQGLDLPAICHHCVSDRLREGSAMETFDLLEYQQLAREASCPKKLFELWEDVCLRYERREIGIYQLEEMKEVIWPNLRALAILRQVVNDTAVPADTSVCGYG
jgi:hypothetical protein